MSDTAWGNLNVVSSFDNAVLRTPCSSFVRTFSGCLSTCPFVLRIYRKSPKTTHLLLSELILVSPSRVVKFSSKIHVSGMTAAVGVPNDWFNALSCSWFASLSALYRSMLSWLLVGQTYRSPFLLMPPSIPSAKNSLVNPVLLGGFVVTLVGSNPG